MCGIAGFNLSPTSKINTRALAHELLALIEYRGNHASGFAQSTGGRMSVYKNNVAGSQLPLSGLPRRAKSVVLHTRFATQGSPRNNANNHPVLSPDGTIALVHNGVISNDYLLRKELEPGLAEVDSAVIPAILQEHGMAGLAEMSGYAAIAWLDGRDAKRGDTLHLARLESSPVAYTWLDDGSFVFASTAIMLEAALNELGLEFGHIFEMGEKDYFRVVGGVIREFRDDVGMMDDWAAWERYSSATAGNHDSGTERYNSYGMGTGRAQGIGASFGLRAMEDEDPSDDGWVFDEEKNEYRRMTWDEDYRFRSGESCDLDDNVAMAMAPETNGESGGNLQGYYTADLDDALEFYPDLDTLESALAWRAQLVMHDDVLFPEAGNKVRWINHIKDMGEITVTGGIESWFEDMSLIDPHESPAVHNLNYVREAIGMALGIKGA